MVELGRPMEPSEGTTTVRWMAHTSCQTWWGATCTTSTLATLLRHHKRVRAQNANGMAY